MTTAAASAPEPEDESQNKRLPTVTSIPSVADLRANLEGKATPAQLEALSWLVITAHNLRMTTFSAVAKFVKTSETTMSRILRGKYESDLGPVVADILELKESMTEQQTLNEMPFVKELSIVKDRIVPFCEVVRLTHQIGLMWGENQTGKSWGFEHYAAQKGRDVIVWRTAGGGAVNLSIENLGEACGVPTSKSTAELWRRCMDRITRNTLVIVDEFHQCFIGRSLKMVLIEKMREIHDVKKCGMVFAGTEIFMEELKAKKFRKFLGQIGNRGVLRMNIPTAPEPSDLPLLYAAYGLPEPKGGAKKIADKIASENGIGKLTKYFQIARMLASNAGQPLSWEFFLKTHDTIHTWSGEVAA